MHQTKIWKEILGFLFLVYFNIINFWDVTVAEPNSQYREIIYSKLLIWVLQDPFAMKDLVLRCLALLQELQFFSDQAILYRQGYCSVKVVDPCWRDIWTNILYHFIWFFTDFMCQLYLLLTIIIDYCGFCNIVLDICYMWFL